MKMSFQCITDKYWSIEKDEIITLDVIEWFKGRTGKRTTTVYPICERFYDGKKIRFHMFPSHFQPIEVDNG